MSVETVDGRIYMNMRSRQNKLLRAYAWSEDGGETWSEVKFDPGMPEPSVQGSLVRFTTADKHGRNRVLLAHPSSRTERARLTVRMSYDECRTWPVAKLLHQEYSGYSDMAIAPDMTVLWPVRVRMARQDDPGPLHPGLADRRRRQPLRYDRRLQTPGKALSCQDQNRPGCRPRSREPVPPDYGDAISRRSFSACSGLALGEAIPSNLAICSALTSIAFAITNQFTPSLQGGVVREPL